MEIIYTTDIISGITGSKFIPGTNNSLSINLKLLNKVIELIRTEFYIANTLTFPNRSSLMPSFKNREL